MNRDGTPKSQEADLLSVSGFSPTTRAGQIGNKPPSLACSILPRGEDNRVPLRQESVSQSSDRMLGSHPIRQPNGMGNLNLGVLSYF